MSKVAKPSMFIRVLGGIWYVLVCTGLFFVASFAGWFGRSGIPFTRIIIPPKPQETFNRDVETFLILGCDEDYKPGSYTKRYYTGEENGTQTPDSQSLTSHAARSDMMMVARMDFVKNEITGVSIPRDTWCRLDGYDEHKINAYHAIAKAGQENELARQAVQHLIGVPIDKVIVIDFDKMQKLVDMMGGVYVNVPKKMDYDDNAGQLHIHLKPGYQKLDGYAAMGYVRFRHSNHKAFSETDFQRQQREKDMLLGFKEAAMRGGGTHLPDVARAGREALGDALTDDQLLSLAFFARGVNSQKIKIGVIPTRERGNGLDVDADKLPEVLAQYKLNDNAARVSQR